MVRLVMLLLINYLYIVYFSLRFIATTLFLIRLILNNPKPYAYYVNKFSNRF